MDEEMVKRFGKHLRRSKPNSGRYSGSCSAVAGRAETDRSERPSSDRVDIVAQPPGKKLQNLGLMSGGERALTSIALLFSILKVKTGAILHPR